jgi:hypothetical protein
VYFREEEEEKQRGRWGIFVGVGERQIGQAFIQIEGEKILLAWCLLW